MAPSGLLPAGRPAVMGVLNATPDSFWPESRHLQAPAAAEAAARMEAAGADLLDLGAVSSRPGAAAVPEDEELARLLPVLCAVRAAVRCPLSVDTTRAGVARRALRAGATVVNDVSGRADPALAAAAGEAGAWLILVARQAVPDGHDPVAAVAAELAALRARAAGGGAASERIILDPGFGFGKTPAQNLALLAGLPRLRAELGAPLCVGVSRKSTISAVLGGRPVGGRLWGTAGLVALAAAYGAGLLRVHDVAEMADVARIAAAVGPPRPRAPGPGRICLRGLRLLGCHGVLPEERVHPQPFLVDLELELDLGPAGRTDALADTANYAEVAALAAAVIAGPHRDLIERLAAEIAQRLETRFPALLGGTVTVHKPEAPVGLPVADVAVTWALRGGRARGATPA